MVEIEIDVMFSQLPRISESPRRRCSMAEVTRPGIDGGSRQRPNQISSPPTTVKPFGVGIVESHPQPPTSTPCSTWGHAKRFPRERSVRDGVVHRVSSRHFLIDFYRKMRHADSGEAAYSWPSFGGRGSQRRPGGQGQSRRWSERGFAPHRSRPAHDQHHRFTSRFAACGFAPGTASNAFALSSYASSLVREQRACAWSSTRFRTITFISWSKAWTRPISPPRCASYFPVSR